jgi:DNA-binding NarL/FixJ family response regulator
MNARMSSMPAPALPQLDSATAAELVRFDEQVTASGAVQLATSPNPDSLLATLSRLGRQAEVAQLVRRLSKSAVASDESAELSEREIDVVSRLIHGDRVPAIADSLYLSQSTVRNYLAAVFHKLGVRNQQGLFDALRQSRPELTNS